MDEAVDEGDDAGGVGEDVRPFAEGFVGGQYDGSLLIPARGDFEHFALNHQGRDRFADELWGF